MSRFGPSIVDLRKKLTGWTTTTSRGRKPQFLHDVKSAAQRRTELLNPPAPELTGGMAAGMRGLAGAYGRVYGQARSANEARYQKMLGIAAGERRRQAGVQRGMLGAIGETTGQRAADIRSEGAGEQANIMQRLARQGMAGTTIAPTMRAGVRRGTGEQLNRLSDLMLQQRLGVMQRQAAPRRGTELGIMERRTDAYPDPTALTGAFGAIGQGYGGAGIEAMLGALSRTYR